MTLTGGYHRLTKDQEGSSTDITCIKIAKNKCKLGTSRLRGWLIGPFMYSLGSCLEQLKVCMEKPDTFPTEKIFLLNR